MVQPATQDAPTGNGHVGPRFKPAWFDWSRQVIMFLLGLALILDAVITGHHDAIYIVSGLVLMGIIPLDTALSHWSRNHGTPLDESSPSHDAPVDSGPSA
jgi:hypothetical protein